MSQSAIACVERQLGFSLPTDFSYLLRNVLDPGRVLFQWSDFSREKYDEAIASIFDGIAFDIVRNSFWLEERWGNPPASMPQRLEVARRDFPRWPKLLPIYGHRFLAAEPCMPDNPVFSIKQTDIIYYGANLAHYLLQEFIDHDYPEHTYRQDIRRIEVWSDLTS